MTSWNKNLQPEGATTVSRFHQRVDIPSAAIHPAAHTVFSARCEVTHKDICTPTSPLVMSSSGSCLTVAHIGDYKADRPLTSYWLPDPNGDIGEMELVTRLAYAIKHSAVDESRKLMFFADKHRIKSFHWDEGLPVHTMRSGKCNGPLAVLPHGKLARAGTGCAAVWNLDTLQTHGERGRDVIGQNTYEGPEYTDMEIEDIEESTGSTAHAVIKFDDPKYKPSHWLMHTPTSYMLCAENRDDRGSSAYKSTRGHGFITFDLAQGKTVARYGEMHSQVLAFSVSDGDPQAFAAACQDGYARLYDIRQPSPKSKIFADQHRSEFHSIALANPDGIPVLFTGGQLTESISLWDLRANKVVYELATGNNGVESLAWDSLNTTLYASTTCNYIDRRGNFYGYRPLKHSKLRGINDNHPMDLTNDTGMDSDEEEDSDWDDDDDEDVCWPKDAVHSEDYFGYAFDSGDHRLFRYRFKNSADINVLPKYGDASCQDSGYW